MEIKHKRKSIRRHEYDYSSPCLYFITICTHDKKCLFGEIIDNEMKLNEFGGIVKQQWSLIPNRFNTICLDEFIVMPNHIHGIIQIVGAPLAGAHPCAAGAHPCVAGAISANRATVNRAPARGAPTIGAIVGAYKSLCVNQCLKFIKQNNQNLILGTVWQRNYYDHIIRNELSLNKIREYIINNPTKWGLDRYH